MIKAHVFLRHDIDFDQRPDPTLTSLTSSLLIIALYFNITLLLYLLIASLTLAASLQHLGNIFDARQAIISKSPIIHPLPLSLRSSGDIFLPRALMLRTPDHLFTLSTLLFDKTCFLYLRYGLKCHPILYKLRPSRLRRSGPARARALGL